MVSGRQSAQRIIDHNPIKPKLQKYQDYGCPISNQVKLHSKRCGFFHHAEIGNEIKKYLLNRIGIDDLFLIYTGTILVFSLRTPEQNVLVIPTYEIMERALS